ncbi:MAG: hypothetical protein CMH83_02185 [Nocardioides sp.]|nr:hypothetical protein [Nocardioides sp.]
MVTVLVLVVTAATVVSALVAARPATERSLHRAAARRRALVEAQPTRATYADILTELVADGVSREQARFVTEKAADDGIRPFTMWLWLRQFDARALSVVVAADLPHQDLLMHIGNGTVPDLEELSLFASANGLDVAGAEAAVAPTAAPVAESRRPMPAVFGPGTLPGGGRIARRRGDLAA